MSSPHYPDNRDAKSAMDRVTGRQHTVPTGRHTAPQRSVTTGNHSASRPTVRPPTGTQPRVRSSGSFTTASPAVLPPGDPSCRPLSSPMSLGGRALVLFGLLAALQAGVAYFCLRDLERAEIALPRLFPGGLETGPVLEVLGADLGVGLFWLTAMLLPIAVAWLTERITQRVWLGLVAGSALVGVQVVLGPQFPSQISGWAIEAAQWDPRGFAAGNVPAMYGMMFVTAAIGTFAGRRGDGLMYVAAVVIALWLAFEAHQGRVEGWRVVLEAPLSRVNMGIGRGDTIVTARRALEGASQWLHLRAVLDVLWLLAPAWIVGGATR